MLQPVAFFFVPLQWRHNELDGISDHQPHDCLLNRLFRRRSNKTSKLRVTGLCAGNSPVTAEFPAQKASNAENVSIWWRHHGVVGTPMKMCGFPAIQTNHGYFNYVVQHHSDVSHLHLISQTILSLDWWWTSTQLLYFKAYHCSYSSFKAIHRTG